MMDTMKIYKCRDTESGKIVTQSNILLSIVNVAKMSAIDERLLKGSEILDPDGKVIYLIRGGQTEPEIDLTADYPEMLPHPFKNKSE